MAFSGSTSLCICLGLWISLYLVSPTALTKVDSIEENEQCPKGFDVNIKVEPMRVEGPVRTPLAWFSNEEILELKAFLQERRDAPLKAACGDVCSKCYPAPGRWPDLGADERNQKRRKCEDECFRRKGDTKCM